MNVNNGEILSMVSLPDFNPNYPSSILPKPKIILQPKLDMKWVQH